MESAGFEARLLGSGDASTMRLSIGGMTCASCSTAVEAALKGTPGVHEASVSIITGTAEVGPNCTHDTCEHLAGFAADISFVVEAALMGTPGVHEASVSLITSIAGVGTGATADKGI